MEKRNKKEENPVGVTWWRGGVADSSPGDEKNGEWQKGVDVHQLHSDGYRKAGAGKMDSWGFIQQMRKPYGLLFGVVGSFAGEWQEKRGMTEKGEWQKGVDAHQLQTGGSGGKMLYIRLV